MRSAQNSALLDTSFLYGGNAVFIEQQYAKWAANPASVDASWATFFAGMGDGAGDAQRAASGPSWKRNDWPKSEVGEWVATLDGNWALIEPKIEKKLTEKVAAAPANAGKPVSEVDVMRATRDSIKALMMIRAYRIRGHLAAKLDPLGLDEGREPQPELQPESYGFGPEDMDRPIFIDFVLGMEYATPRQMLDVLNRTYCSTVGIEFMHISDPAEKSWLQERIEGPDKSIAFTNEGKKAILSKVIQAETFEKFLHKRFPGTKRFGLDGGEALIPAME
ncbi:MAG: 2-oxoglutarate dehydrogenase E1 subunit family protein, partial [Hyphomonadaceae bacterium]